MVFECAEAAGERNEHVDRCPPTGPSREFKTDLILLRVYEKVKKEFLQAYHFLIQQNKYRSHDKKRKIARER